MKIYFVRHGESEANAAHKVSEDLTELTQTGRIQAAAAANQLQDRGIAVLLTSPLIRARQTAQIIADELGGIRLAVLDKLTERNLGDYKGQPRPEDKNYFYEINEGKGLETHQELTQRAQSVLSEIAEVAHSTDGKVLVVAHAILGFFMRNIADGNLEYEDFDWSLKISNAEVVEIEIDKNWGEL